MRIIETVKELREKIEIIDRPLGFVPTMGAVHEGHLELIRRANLENEKVVASLFVNPGQFGHSEDFKSYPRDIHSDITQLKASGIDIVFVPSVHEMYPAGFSTYVDVGPISNRLEGEYRSGHFRGVATVVCKLLSIVRPDKAYFGQKDAQQNVVVMKLNADLNLGAKIVVVPTVREPEGLAISSRNIYLNPRERQSALILYESLCLAKRIWITGVIDADDIRQQMI